jgi:hypothetical protein
MLEPLKASTHKRTSLGGMYTQFSAAKNAHELQAQAFHSQM